MTALLTWNGIPPQIVGSLTEQQQQDVVRHAHADKIETYRDWYDTGAIPSAFQPFARSVAAVAESFTSWGASIIDDYNSNKVELNSRYVNASGTTYPSDFNIHSDGQRTSQLHYNKQLLVVRFLSVSSAPADFIDVTGHENMGAILDQYRIGTGRVYKPELLTFAQINGQLVKPNPWDTVVFDAATPHNPAGALEPNQRILQHAWIEMLLPPDWQARVKSGDAPKFQPA